jgi:hypothetical protein
MTPARLTTTIAATAALVAATLLGAAPAYAGTGNCPSGSACVWKDTNYKTAGSDTNYKSFGQYIWGYYQYSWGSGAGNINDNVTSLYNNGNLDSTRWYQDILGGGPYFSLAKKTGDGSLANAAGNAPSGWNDRISSSYFASFYP